MKIFLKISLKPLDKTQNYIRSIEDEVKYLNKGKVKMERCLHKMSKNIKEAKDDAEQA